MYELRLGKRMFHVKRWYSKKKTDGIMWFKPHKYKFFCTKMRYFSLKSIRNRFLTLVCSANYFLIYRYDVLLLNYLTVLSFHADTDKVQKIRYSFARSC